MSSSEIKITGSKTNRLLSLDVMRGGIMILLAAESCRLYDSLYDLSLPAFWHSLIRQFFHHPWHGLHAWDLVQPAFMTIAGTAMYLSYYYRSLKGETWQQHFKHIAFRCFKLFLCGTGLYCIQAGRLVWELWNVLTQLSFTTLLAYGIIRKCAVFQLCCTVALLLLTELLYRTVLMPGFDQPFVEHHNFGAWMDMVLMGKLNPDGLVTINCIPTAAHTIWGVLAGKVLVSAISQKQKIKLLLLAGITGILLGTVLDLSDITPIIKRISTASFVLASGGWVFLILAGMYWITDIRQLNRWAWIPVVVGMNAIFIYLFFETVGGQWFNGAVGVFTNGFAALCGIPEKGRWVITALATLAAEWYLCWWLYKRQVFFKL
jgi:predicted acyltransferase